MIMDLNLGDGPVLQKTRELCQTIVDQSDFRVLRRHIEAFLADESAKQQYRELVEKGEFLHHKQHQGVQLSPEEINDFERRREALVNNPLARDFLAAQQSVQNVQETIGRYVARTLELGRVPAPEDFENCGTGCSCHH
jgi:cell fate (sporulation/competence/biofilm development) regulator YlbF (YheA/YmcA/DUF963 family)